MSQSSNVVSASQLVDLQSQSSLSVAVSESAMAQSEINDLCSTLRKSDHKVACLGYLCSPNNQNYEVHCVRRNIPSKSKPDDLISLAELLDKTSNIRLERRQRFRLAVILASSLIQLQATPWLTSNLAKKDIYFEYQGSDVFSDEPYIRHTFPSINSSLSPASPEIDTPTAISRVVIKSALHQLGILLLELCFGAPIESRTAGDSSLPNDQVQLLAALDWLSLVEGDAGLDYKHAIVNCFHFDGKADWGNAMFTQSIHAGVVIPLEKTLSGLRWDEEIQQEEDE